MRYWYQKERYEQHGNSGHGGDSGFIGHRELIYRGEDKPKELIVRYLEFLSKDHETLPEYYQRFMDTVKIIPSQKHLDEYTPESNLSTETWKIDWRMLTDYDEEYYSHNPIDIVEITKEKFEMITRRTIK